MISATMPLCVAVQYYFPIATSLNHDQPQTLALTIRLKRTLDCLPVFRNLKPTRSLLSFLLQLPTDSLMYFDFNFLL